MLTTFSREIFLPKRIINLFKKLSNNKINYQQQKKLFQVQNLKIKVYEKEDQYKLKIKTNDINISNDKKNITQDEEGVDKTMNYYVIGVSGVTSGGKTTLSKLLQKSFPWCKTIHQDAYFYPDDYEGHVRLPDCENHANFELFTALNMEKMEKDVNEILLRIPNDAPKNNDKTPNFDEVAINLIKNILPIDVDTTKYSHLPILIVEGFTIFASKKIYDLCDARIFLTLDEAECKKRRSSRNFDPPDGPGYFEKAIWPEYIVHFKDYIKPHSEPNDILTIDGTENIQKIWSDSVKLIVKKIDEKLDKSESVKNHKSF